MKFVGTDNNNIFTQEFNDSQSTISEENYVTYKVNLSQPNDSYRLVATLENGDIIDTHYRIVVD